MKSFQVTLVGGPMDGRVVQITEGCTRLDVAVRGENGLGRVVYAARTADMAALNIWEPRSTIAPHAFVGRLDRWCEVCNRPDRNPIHTIMEKNGDPKTAAK